MAGIVVVESQSGDVDNIEYKYSDRPVGFLSISIES